MRKDLAGVTRGAKLAAATAVVAMVLAVAPSQAQDASVSVPAGQTSTVSLPVPVDVSYAGEGWNINASGGSATITAPPEGGQVTVPVTYEGTTISLTLVADGSVTQEDLNNAGEDIANGGDGGAVLHGGGGTAGDAAGSGPAGEGSGSGSGADGGAGAGSGGAGTADENGGGDGAAAGAQGGVPGGAPANNPAAAGGVDVSQAEYINLDATIEGQTITAQMGVMQALDLYNRFKDTDEAGVTLRYLNAKGEFIKGVQRKVDKSSRTLELTYPEGQTPDNPFIMELVRDSDNAAVLVVTLTDPNKETAGEVPNPDNGSGEGANADSKNGSSILPWAIGAGGVLLLIVLGWLLSRRLKSSQEAG